MKNKTIAPMLKNCFCWLLGSFFLFSCLGLEAMDLNWKVIHEKADQETLRDALVNVVNDSKSQEALYELALVYLNLYKVEDAQDVFQDMLRLNADSIEGQWGLAEILRRRHHLGKSRILLESILKKSPDYWPAAISLAYLLFEEGHYEVSLQMAAKIVVQGMGKGDKTSYVRACLIAGEAHGILAQKGGWLGRLVHGPWVLPYLRKAEKLAPESADVLYGLGSYYLLAPSFVGGNKDKALSYLKKSITRDPFLVDATARYAQALWMKGEKEKAVTYLQKALELDPFNYLALTIRENYGLKDKVE